MNRKEITRNWLTQLLHKAYIVDEKKMHIENEGDMIIRRTRNNQTKHKEEEKELNRIKCECGFFISRKLSMIVFNKI